MRNLRPADFARLRELTAGMRSGLHVAQRGEHPHARPNSTMPSTITSTAPRVRAVLMPMIESLWLQSGPYVHAAAFLHDETQRSRRHAPPLGTDQGAGTARRGGAVTALTRDITRAFNLIRNRLDADEAEAEAAHHG